jgi:hypothetical protein
MKLLRISVLAALVALAAGCEEIPFDKDYDRIIEFADASFKERITPYFDTNGDGYISVKEAGEGRAIPYGENAARVVMDCDNSGGAHASLFNIDEVRFFTNVQVLRFGGNILSGTIDLRMLKSLTEIDFSDNGDIDKIILNSVIESTVKIATDPDVEIEYYTDPETN